MKLTHFLLFLSFLVWSRAGTAQILPPELLCLSGDTIKWELPINTCGPFQAYEIYFSTDFNGPYSLLTSIADINETAFLHPNPGNLTYYYYMVSDNDCPGEPQLSSDTLSSLLPEVPQILGASVSGGDVELSWAPSPSPETFAYIIYRLIGGNVDPIDTVFSGTFYLDTGADPGGMSEQYYVLALDQCGNTSVFQPPHRTLFLEGNSGVCERQINLSWNLYQNWPNGIETQNLSVSVNNGPFSLTATLAAGDSTFAYQDLDDGNEYCFFLEATESGTGISASSNSVCITADIIQPVRDLALLNLSVQPDQSIDLSWVWQPDGEINTVTAFRSDLGQAGFSPAVNFPVTFPLSPSNTINDPVAVSATGPVSYYVEVVDDCDTSFRTEVGQTVYLSGTAQADRQNLVTWTPLGIPGSTPTGYDLFRIVAGIPQYVGSFDGNTLTYLDPVDVKNPLEAEVCYFVLARGVVALPDNTQVNIESRSNTACVRQQAAIAMPNAFAPNGINNEFRPAALFGQTLASYRMQIYDRWGQLLFESTNITQGWRGDRDGRPLPQGVYVYMVELTQANGAELRQQGTVILLR